MNFRFRPKNQSQFWWRPFFFLFWRPPDFGRKKRMNFQFRPKNHSQFRWRHPNFWSYVLKIPPPHQKFLDPPLAVLTTRVQRFFSLVFFFKYHKWKIVYSLETSATVQALKVCPVRPRVFQFGQKSCPAGEYLQLKNKKIKIWLTLKTIVTCALFVCRNFVIKKTTKAGE